jgi:hypothetical protein
MFSLSESKIYLITHLKKIGKKKHKDIVEDERRCLQRENIYEEIGKER